VRGRDPAGGAKGVVLATVRRRHVENGRIVVDEGVDLPDGTEVQVAVLDDADQLDAEDRVGLHAALDRSQAEVDAGQVVPQLTSLPTCAPAAGDPVRRGARSGTRTAGDSSDVERRLP
jgi:hypothetical protein